MNVISDGQNEAEFLSTDWIFLILFNKKFPFLFGEVPLNILFKIHLKKVNQFLMIASSSLFYF